jgi:hypothetical protein
MMGYLDQALTARINAKVDELNTRIAKAESLNKAAKDRLDEERAERLIRTNERKRQMQVQADELFSQHGAAPPVPISDESSSSYRRRCIVEMQKRLAPGDPFSLLRQPNLVREDRATLDVLEPRLRESFVKAVPNTVAPGELREIRSTDAGGYKVSSFIGRQSFIHDMVSPVFKVLSTKSVCA